MKAEWWEKHKDYQRLWEPYLADPTRVQKKHEQQLKHRKEYNEWIKRQAELKKKRDEVWQGEITDDGTTVETSDS